jgi:very-short-patch-repair endonuclease
MEPLFPKPSPFWKAEYASPQDATQKETPGGVHPEPGEEVIRFANNDVMNNLDGVLAEIKKRLL